MSMFDDIFKNSLNVHEGLLGEVIDHVTKRGGKRMRPVLVFLVCKALHKDREVPQMAQHAACSLELLHTASLVHDDVVDESGERRGQLSVNSAFNNKVAVLSGDYILSTSLRESAETGSTKIVDVLAKLGQTLSEGEILQLQNVSDFNLSYDVYYNIIEKKTASLFEACCQVACISAEVSEELMKEAMEFGKMIGIIFQIRDDIFDYDDTADIGKPTGNDMAEGKLTLPVLYALNTCQNEEMMAIAKRVKMLSATKDEIARLVAFTKENGGIEYARKVMDEKYQKAAMFIADNVKDEELGKSLTTYLNYVIGRNY